MGTDVANPEGAFDLMLRDGALEGIRVGTTADDTKGLILEKAMSGCKSPNKGLADGASDGAPVGLIVSVGILTDGGDADGASDGAPVGLIVSVGFTVTFDGGIALGSVLDRPASPLTA